MLTKFWRYQPINNLTTSIKQITGKNNHGRITINHRGGGNSKNYRLIDYHRQFLNIPALIVRLERAQSSRVIALLCYSNGVLSYILSTTEFPKQLYNAYLGFRRVVISGYNIPSTSGNAKPLQLMPLGIDIHNVDGKYVRTAAGRCQILRRTLNFSFVRMLSRRITFNQKYYVGYLWYIA